MAHPIEVDNEHHSTGCFDDIFAVFKNYSHPIILVEFCAFKWMGLGAMKRVSSSAISYPCHVMDDKC